MEIIITIKAINKTYIDQCTWNVKWKDECQEKLASSLIYIYCESHTFFSMYQHVSILFCLLFCFARKLQFSLSFLENLNPRKKLHKYRIVCEKLKRGINGDEVVPLDIHM